MSDPKQTLRYPEVVAEDLDGGQFRRIGLELETQVELLREP